MSKKQKTKNIIPGTDNTVINLLLDVLDLQYTFEENHADLEVYIHIENAKQAALIEKAHVKQAAAIAKLEARYERKQDQARFKWEKIVGAIESMAPEVGRVLRGN